MLREKSPRATQEAAGFIPLGYEKRACQKTGSLFMVGVAGLEPMAVPALCAGTALRGDWPHSLAADAATARGCHSRSRGFTRRDEKRQPAFADCLFWSEWRDLNPRPLGPEPSTLPTALHPDASEMILYCLSPEKSSAYGQLFCFFISLYIINIVTSVFNAAFSELTGFPYVVERNNC